MNTWGYLERSAAGRGAWLRERLVLLPPGTSDAERRALAITRNLPVAGAIGALLLMIPLGSVLTPPAAFALAFALYAALLWRGSRVTRRLREASMRLVVIAVPRAAGVRSYGNVAALRWAVRSLRELDARAGELSPAEYEAAWGAVYWRLHERREALGREVERGILESETL